MTNRDSNAIAILGGTGDQGLGLALRFAAAGRPVRIGSRKEDRALTAADEVRAKVPGADVTGHENAEATRRAEIVILSVPFEHTAGTLDPPATMFSIVPSGDDIEYSLPPMRWMAVGHVEVSFSGEFVDDDGCHYVFPSGVFSYDLEEL